MPCDTQRTITTDLAAANPEVLGRALVAAGFSMILRGDGETLSIQRVAKGATFGIEVATLRRNVLSGYDPDVFTEIKKAYASEAVRTAAKRHGWAVKGAQDADTLTVVRRTL